MTEHTLKTWPTQWQALAEGRKCFELRRDDRGFAEGDTLRLVEFDPDLGCYTGHLAERVVTYVLRDAEHFGLQPGFVVLGLALGPFRRRKMIGDEAAELYLSAVAARLAAVDRKDPRR